MVKDCPVCLAKNSTKNLARLSNTSLYRCHYCTVVFVHPNFHDQNEDFFNAYQVDQWLKYYQHFRLRSHQQFISRHQDLLSPIKSVLDIGCAAGWFLDAIKKKGTRTVGVEPSPAMIDQINKKHRYYPITAEQINQINGRFDLISFWNVFEHFPNPHQILKLVIKKTKPGGLLILSVPDQNGLISRLSYLLAFISAGRWRMPLEELFETENAFGHLFHYNQRSLTELLKKHRFTPIEWQGADIVDVNNVRQRLKITPHHFDESRQLILAVLVAQITRLARLIGWQDELVVIAQKT